MGKGETNSSPSTCKDGTCRHPYGDVCSGGGEWTSGRVGHFGRDSCRSAHTGESRRRAQRRAPPSRCLRAPARGYKSLATCCPSYSASVCLQEPSYGLARQSAWIWTLRPAPVLLVSPLPLLQHLYWQRTPLLCLQAQGHRGEEPLVSPL